MNPTADNIILWVLIAFFLGSIPFSVIISQWFGKDARSVGDGNPGATNALKVGGWYVGLLALLLDISKAAAPVGLAFQIWDWRGWGIIAVAIGSLLGSAFSPFLRFKGGKSLSVSLGIWVGLTLWEAPLVILSSLSAAYLIQNLAGWAVLAAIFSTAIYLFASHAEAPLYVILAMQTVVLIWKHRKDFITPPQLRSWLTRK